MSSETTRRKSPGLLVPTTMTEIWRRCIPSFAWDLAACEGRGEREDGDDLRQRPTQISIAPADRPLGSHNFRGRHSRPHRGHRYRPHPSWTYPGGPGAASDLLAVQVERGLASDNNPEYDWYAIRFSVQNNATVPEVHPYSLEVLVRLPNAVTFNWAPANGHPFYQAITREDGPRGFGFALGAAELRVPAGDFRTSSNFNGSSPGGMSTQWMALGEEGLNRVPIFENAVDFVVFGIQVPEGTSLEAQIVVTLTWGYYGPLQAYPVESRTVTEATPFT